MKKLLFIALLAFPFLNGCYYDNFSEIHPNSICNLPDSVSYARDIMPILSASCGTGNASCHNSRPTGGGKNLTDFQSVVTDSQDSTSYFIDRIKHSASLPSGINPMPKGGEKLSDCDISKIERWISQNYPL